MKTRTKISILIIALLFVVAAVLRISSKGPQADTRRQSPTQVKISLPRRQLITRSIRLTGDVLPIQQAQVFARVYANLETVRANIGDFVRENQVLATVDTTELAQQCRQAEATYQNASSLYDRAKSLQSQNLISTQDFDNAETGKKVAKESFGAARTRLDYAIITAPFPGLITRRYLDPGALLTSNNATLFTLMDLDTIKVMVNVLEKDVPLVRTGTKAVVTVNAFPGRSFEGSIARLSGAVDLATRTMPIEIDIANRDRALRPGMFATVLVIFSEQRDALIVPTQALLNDAKGHYVMTAGKGLAHRKPVTIGAEQESSTEISSGLTETDSIITTGQQFTRDGSAINVQ